MGSVFSCLLLFPCKTLSSSDPVARLADSLRDQEAQLCFFCYCPQCQKPSPVARIQLSAWGCCTGLNLLQLASSTALRGSTLTFIAGEATRITRNSDDSDKEGRGLHWFGPSTLSLEPGEGAWMVTNLGPATLGSRASGQNEWRLAGPTARTQADPSSAPSLSQVQGL